MMQSIVTVFGHQCPVVETLGLRGAEQVITVLFGGAYRRAYSTDGRRWRFR